MWRSGSCHRSYVCRRLSVTFMHATQPVEILRNVSTPFYTLAIRWPLCKNFTKIVVGEPFHLGLNARGVIKYSDVLHVEGYISERVQDTASGLIND